MCSQGQTLQEVGFFPTNCGSRNTRITLTLSESSYSEPLKKGGSTSASSLFWCQTFAVVTVNKKKRKMVAALTASCHYCPLNMSIKALYTGLELCLLWVSQRKKLSVWSLKALKCHFISCFTVAAVFNRALIRPQSAALL